jgi:hypothetical protein
MNGVLEILDPYLPTIGLVVGFIITVYIFLFSPISIFEIFSWPGQLLLSILHLLGLKKRKSYWGIVYDSVTKQPIDPAFVELRDSVGKVVRNVITDLDGRYGFVGQTPGVYTLNVRKTHYAFPSQLLAGLTKDGKYSDLYFGEQIILTAHHDSILKNIPLDPLEPDWNESAKKDQGLLSAYTRRDLLLRFFTGWFFMESIIITAWLSFRLSPPYTYIVYGVFLISNLIRVYYVASAPFGIIKEHQSGLPLPFAKIHIFYDSSLPQPMEFGTKICDREGKYYCLIPKGRYFITIEKKNLDQSYTQVYKSEPFTISNGILNATFEV